MYIILQVTKRDVIFIFSVVSLVLSSVIHSTLSWSLITIVADTIIFCFCEWNIWLGIVELDERCCLFFFGFLLCRLHFTFPPAVIIAFAGWRWFCTKFHSTFGHTNKSQCLFSLLLTSRCFNFMWDKVGFHWWIKGTFQISGSSSLFRKVWCLRQLLQAFFTLSKEYS